MKSKLISIVLFIIMVLTSCLSFATEGQIETEYTINISVLEKNEDYKLYMLLPASYIEYAIENAGLDIQYKGIETIEDNDIPGITDKRANVQSSVYKESEVEYIQILLDDLGNDEYSFSVLKGYTTQDLKLRIKSDTKDYIMHMENFTIKNSECNMEYNYSTNEFKNIYDVTSSESGTIQIWQIVLVVLIIIAIGFITKKLND